jgi:hypothetical protein
MVMKRACSGLILSAAWMLWVLPASAPAMVPEGFDPEPPASVPEPTSLAILAGAVALLATRSPRQSRQR